MEKTGNPFVTSNSIVTSTRMILEEMQKTKRKVSADDTPVAKKKKVQFAKSEEDQTEKISGKEKFRGQKKDFNKSYGKQKGEKKHFIKGEKMVEFKKGGPKVVKNFSKPGLNKPNFSKDKPLSKEDTNGEKPKWSEMKKEKKQLRIVRRKAKASAEVFEISHKAKLLAAQIQRYCNFYKHII